MLIYDNSHKYECGGEKAISRSTTVKRTRRELRPENIQYLKLLGYKLKKP